MASTQPTAAEIPHLAELAAWTQGLLLEDSMTVVSLGQCGVEAKVIAELLGQKVRETIFPTTFPSPGGEDVIPFQTRQLMDYQLRTIAHHLQHEDQKEAREKGRKDIKNAKAQMKKDTAKLKKGVVKQK